MHEVQEEDGYLLAEKDALEPTLAHLSPEAAVRVSRRAIAGMCGIGAAEAAILVASVLLLRAAIDSLVVSVPSSSQFIALTVALAALAILGAVLRSLEFAVSESIGYRYVMRLRMVMYGHLQRMPPRQLLRNSRGAILLRFMGDLTAIRTWVSRGIARGIVATMAIVAGVGVLVVLDPLMALVTVAMLTIGVGISLPIGANVRRAARSVRRQRANLSTNLAEQIHSMASVQVMGRAAGEFDRLGRQNARLTGRLVRYAWLRGWLRSVSSGSGGLAVVAVLVVGAFDVNAGRTTVGAVVAAMTVARYLLAPIRVVSLAFDYSQSARVSREKILAFLSRPCRELDGSQGARLRVKQGLLEFRDVHLAQSLFGISGEVQPGQIVAIMGPNGAGKSSLLSVVARLADPDSGEVLVDGQVLTQCSLRSCARHISLVSRDIPLMRGSLERNLRYRWREAPESELARIIELCGLGPVIAQYPRGLLGGVKEGGANLAAGHAARLILARAMVGNPKILLVDEPTSCLDEGTKLVFRESLMRYGGTVLMATHDPEDAAIADVVWMMEEGRIAERMSGAAFRESMVQPLRLPAWALACDRR